jgi:hypothetical protein
MNKTQLKNTVKNFSSYKADAGDWTTSTDKNEKEEFFSEEFFTINKKIFPFVRE